MKKRPHLIDKFFLFVRNKIRGRWFIFSENPPLTHFVWARGVCSYKEVRIGEVETPLPRR